MNRVYVSKKQVEADLAEIEAEWRRRREDETQAQYLERIGTKQAVEGVWTNGTLGNWNAAIEPKSSVSMTSPTASQRGGGLPQIENKRYYDAGTPGAEAEAIASVIRVYEELLAWPDFRRDSVVQKCSAFESEGKTIKIDSLERALSKSISDKWVGSTLAKVREMRKRLEGA